MVIVQLRMKVAIEKRSLFKYLQIRVTAAIFDESTNTAVEKNININIHTHPVYFFSFINQEYT